MPFTLIALMSLGRSVGAQGKNAIISNDHLRVLVEPENNSFSHKRTRGQDEGTDCLKLGYC